MTDDYNPATVNYVPHRRIRDVTEVHLAYNHLSRRLESIEYLVRYIAIKYGKLADISAMH
jgi:hypothetical protein